MAPRPQLGFDASAAYGAAGAAASAAGTIAVKRNPALSTSIFATAGGGILSIAPATGPAAPFVAAAGAILELLAFVGVGSGCGPTCTLASGIVDQLEPQLRANRDAYLAGDRTRERQAYALAVFDGAWQWLQSPAACGAGELGDAGKRCISDRAPGGKWDWSSYYRDPIAHDPTVHDAPLSAELLSVFNLSPAESAAIVSQFWLPAVLVLLLILL